MKKIIISLFAVVAVAAIIIGGTIAYFSDTESSTNNEMAVGTMDLNINGGNVAVQTLNLVDKAPGDAGKEMSMLKNVGSLEGELDIAMSAITNYPCTDGANGGKNDGTEYCVSDPGALGANMETALYLDKDKSGNWTVGDVGLKADGTIYTSGDLIYSVMDNYSGKTWDAVVATMVTNDEYNFLIDWKIPTAVGNEIQGDALKFDVTFILEQANGE